MYIIKAKNKEFNGVLSGLIFVKGVAKAENLTDFDILWFKSLEAEIEKEKSPKQNKKDKE